MIKKISDRSGELEKTDPGDGKPIYFKADLITIFNSLSELKNIH